MSFGLGLDAGGSATRWALVDAAGQLRAEGQGAPLWAPSLATPLGRAEAEGLLRRVAAAIEGQGLVSAVWAGISGFGDGSSPHERALADLFSQVFGLPAGPALRLMGDVELACRAWWAPGEGQVLYAGTGSMAACFDAAGQWQRVGGRGPLLSDEGGAQWISLQALRMVWRAEDEAPGSSAAWPLAQALAQALGGADWASARQAVYLGGRSVLGPLAMAVASAAAQDPRALALMHQAGEELARLAASLQRRCGCQPLALAGRAWLLHPDIETSFLRSLARDGALPAQLLRTHAAGQEPVQRLAARRAALAAAGAGA